MYGARIARHLRQYSSLASVHFLGVSLVTSASKRALENREDIIKSCFYCPKKWRFHDEEWVWIEEYAVRDT